MIPMSAILAPADDRPTKRGRESEPLDRLLHALNHPVRRRILQVLAHRSGSASTLSRELGVSLGVVSYHLNQVLAIECDVIEIVDTVPRRGAIEKFYRLKPVALRHRSSELAGGLDLERGRALSLQECLLAAVASIDSGKAKLHGSSSWRWFAAEVDAEARGAIRQAQADFSSRVKRAVEESRLRGAEEAQAVVVGTTAFPSSLHLAAEE